MSILYVDGKRMRRSIMAALKWLIAKQEVLNKLNVYPVPDGDTGTNMVLTLKSATESMEKTGDDLAALTKRLSDGALMGARGNSGVILSQIIRGFAHRLADRSRIGVRELAESFQEAVRRSYAALATPVEGTILTVLRESTEAAAQVAEKDPDIVRFLERLHDEALLSLERTPDKLPVLREAGVVDSGAMGFVCIVEGILRLVRGEELGDGTPHPADGVEGPLLEEGRELKFRFCTEFLLRCTAGGRDSLREFLNGKGESLVFVADDEVVRIHIHTNEPAEILRHARSLGEVSGEKVDDMRTQRGHLLGKEEPRAAVGLFSTAPGHGFKRILESLGVSRVVPGGDTNNPSVEEILRAAEGVNAESLVFLPNNKNIILAGEQASRVVQRPMSIVPTRSVIQGIAAAISFDPDAPAEESVREMNAAKDQVKTLAVTRAEKDSSFRGTKIGKGEYFSLLDGEPLVSDPDLNAAVIESIRLAREDEDMLTVYYGSGLAESDATGLAERIREEFGGLEVEVYEGGQPHYPYYISLE